MTIQSLKSKTIKGLVWSSIDKIGVLIISFLIGLMLARMLMPSDYGLVGMLAIFLTISNLLIESGFSSALIQKHTPTNEDYSTIFYFNLVVSIVFYLILYFTAPLIATFYNTPQLTPITRVLSLNIFLNAFTLVQQTKLIINLDFKTQAKISVLSVLISGSLALYAAYLGYGVWALVIQILSATLVKTLLLFYFNKWLPDWVFSIPSLKQLFRFSSNVLVAGISSGFVNNIYSILIGKYYNAKDLGYYTGSRQYPEYLAGPIGSTLLGVTYPVLVSLKNDRDSMVLVFSRLVRLTVFFVMPVLTLFALLSEPFTRLILTEKWMPLVSLIQWMCFARLLGPICSINMIILNVIGRSDLFLKVELSKLPITIVALVITIPFGLKAIVIGHFVTMVITFFITTYYSGKLFGFGALRQMHEMKTVVIATIIMTAGVFACNYFVTSDFFKLLVGGCSGVSFFLLAAFAMKIEEIKDFKELVLKILPSKND
ncbi:MAG: lipopolysaccharide biosynthesis protein [Bacteroidetes bacterium]|nr:lipopolysaccharide biosynthesis protein [Bacteroidota bacterium]